MYTLSTWDARLPTRAFPVLWHLRGTDRNPNCNSIFFKEKMIILSLRDIELQFGLRPVLRKCQSTGNARVGSRASRVLKVYNSRHIQPLAYSKCATVVTFSLWHAQCVQLSSHLASGMLKVYNCRHIQLLACSKCTTVVTFALWHETLFTIQMFYKNNGRSNCSICASTRNALTERGLLKHLHGGLRNVHTNSF